MTSLRRDGPLDVRTRLVDFAIVSYAVDLAALAALIPPEFEPEVFELADGSRRGLVSAVPFRDVDFTMRVAPWLQLAFAQINYRAYVRRRGEPVVWFFGTMLGSPWVAIPRDLWRLPWHRARIAIDAAWDGERCTSYALDAAGAWGEAELHASGTDEAMGRLDGFTDVEQTSLVLTHPLRGFYTRRDARLGCYAVRHDRLVMTRAVAERARFTVFEALGLTTAADVPHSVLVQRSTDFVIELPPAIVAA